MTMMRSRRPHRQLDVTSLVLLVLGVVFGVVAYWLVTYKDANALVLVPAVVAATTGASHLTKVRAHK